MAHDLTHCGSTGCAAHLSNHHCTNLAYKSVRHEWIATFTLCMPGPAATCNVAILQLWVMPPGKRHMQNKRDTGP